MALTKEKFSKYALCSILDELSGRKVTYPAFPTLVEAAQLKEPYEARKKGQLKLYGKGSVLGIFKLSFLGYWEECFAVVTADRFYLFPPNCQPMSQCAYSLSLLDIKFEDATQTTGKEGSFRIQSPELPLAELILHAPKQDFQVWEQSIREGTRDGRYEVKEYVMNWLIDLQARISGIVARERRRIKMKAIVRIQAWYRSRIARRIYRITQQRILKCQAYVRRFLAQRLYLQLRLESNVAKYQSRRTNIVKEIRDTESTYVRDLETVVKLFLKPLRTLFGESSGSSASLTSTTSTPPNKRSGSARDGLASPTSPISPVYPTPPSSKSSTKDFSVGSEDIANLFGNVEEILAHHQQVVQAFSTVVDNWTETAMIGPVFLQMIEWLDIYIPYCNNYDFAMETLERCKKNDKFRNFLETVGGVKQTKKLDLFGFLIMPVQRMPRYILLVKDLLKYTWRDHPDRENLQKALAELTKMTKFVNEAKRRDENKRKMKQLQDKFVESVDDLFDSADICCIQEGPVDLQRVGEETKSKAFLMLFTDMLVTSRRLTERSLDTKSMSFHKTYRFSDAFPMPLNEIIDSVKLLPKTDKGFPGFSLSHIGRNLRFLTKTESEAEGWVKAITKAQQNLVHWQYEKN